MGECAHIWQTSPEPIVNIASEETTDIVILGAGIAGVVAAHSAREAGASVIVCEKFGKWTAHGIDMGSLNTKVHERLGLKMDPKYAARLVYAWGQQQGNYALIRTYMERSHETMNRYIDLLESKGYVININDDNTARTDWDTLGDNYMMFRSPHIVDVPEGSDLERERWNVAYLVKEVYNEAVRIGAEFRFHTKGEQLIRENGRVTGVIVSDENGYHKINATKGVIIATGGITDNKEMMECFCPLALRADVNENFPKGGNMGDGLVMAKWIGGAFSRVYPAPVIHPVDFTVLAPEMNSSWLMVNRNGKRFCNEVAYEPLITNARMNAPGNVAYAIWDSHYLENFKKQEPNKYARLTVDITEAVEKSVADGDYFKADTIEELAEKINVPAVNLVKTIERYNEICDKGEDDDFAVPERFLSAVKYGPFYATNVHAFLLSLPYGLHVDENSQVCQEDDEPIPGLYAVGSAQGDFFANTYPVTVPGSNHGRGICFGRLVGTALAKGENIDGTKAM